VTDLIACLEHSRVQEQTERQPGKLPALCSKYLELLSSHAPIVGVWAGPVFVFPDDMVTAVHTVSINDTPIGIFCAVALTIGCRISVTGSPLLRWSRTIVPFPFAPASASRMRFNNHPSCAASDATKQVGVSILRPDERRDDREPARALGPAARIACIV
jgi:hypothetical protein